MAGEPRTHTAKLSRPRLYDALPRERLFGLLDEKCARPGLYHLNGIRCTGVWAVIDGRTAIRSLPTPKATSSSASTRYRERPESGRS